jgi:hypothetical protein
MRRSLPVLVFCCSAAVSLFSQNQSSTLTLKGGSVLKGRVVARTESALIIDIGFAAVRVPLAEIAGELTVPSTTIASAGAAQSTNKRTLPRPKLTQVRPLTLSGRSPTGIIGVDAHFSEFGDYLQELIDIVQIQWDRILDAGGARPRQGSHVRISFRLNSKGEIAEMIKVDGDAGIYGTNAAVSAIQDKAPYHPWTTEMIRVLGNNQVLTFDFYYE